MDGFLRMPFKRDELLEVIGRHLGLIYGYGSPSNIANTDNHSKELGPN